MIEALRPPVPKFRDVLRFALIGELLIGTVGLKLEGSGDSTSPARFSSPDSIEDIPSIEVSCALPLFCIFLVMEYRFS